MEDPKLDSEVDRLISEITALKPELGIEERETIERVHAFRRAGRPLHGNYTYELLPDELKSLGKLAARGDCDAAHKIALHHFLVSLDYAAATKYFRIAARCPDVQAKRGLIAVLVTPSDDAEIETTLASLRELDEATWRSAVGEVADKRRNWVKQRPAP